MFAALDPDTWAFCILIPDPEGISGNTLISGHADKFIETLLEYLPVPSDYSPAEFSVSWEKRPTREG